MDARKVEDRRCFVFDEVEWIFMSFPGSARKMT